MPKSRGRKRPQPRTPRRPAPLTWQAAVLRDVRPLLDPGATRQQVELWASRLLGEVGTGKALLRRRARDEWVEQMSSYAGRRRTREAAAFVAALSTVLCDDALAQARADWADALLTDLPWTQAPVERPLTVTRGSDVWQDHQVWFLEYADHVLAVMTARCDPRGVTGLHLLGEEVPARWDQMAARTEGRLLPRSEVPLDQAMAALREASALSERLLLWSSGLDPHGVGHLLGARLRAVEVPPFRDRALDDARREELLTAFCADTGQWRHELFEPFLDFADTYLGDDPLAWSPDLVEVFLLDWAPQLVGLHLDLDLLPAIPQATCLWVRWALQRKGLAPELGLEAAVVALALAPSFRSVCERELLDLGYESDELPWAGSGPAA